MTTKKNLVTGFLCLYAFLISLAFVFRNSIVWPKSVPSQIAMTRLDLEEIYNGESQSDPISYNNLLVYAVRINEISSSLNQAIKRSNLNLPPVRLYSSELSYKSPGRSWIAVNDDLILIFLYHDVSSTLSANEILAIAVHELGHTILGHKNPGSIYQRNTEHEKDADKFAVDSGIDPMILISAISKLAADDEERSERIAALSNLNKN